MMMTEVPGIGSITKGKSPFGLEEREGVPQSLITPCNINNNNNNNNNTSHNNNNHNSSSNEEQDGGEERRGQGEEEKFGGRKSPEKTGPEGSPLVYSSSLGRLSPKRESLKEGQEGQGQIQVRGHGQGHESHHQIQQQHEREEEDMVLDEDYSEEESSDREEHRITVREALMSRAYQAHKFGKVQRDRTSPSGSPLMSSAGQHANGGGGSSRIPSGYSQLPRPFPHPFPQRLGEEWGFGGGVKGEKSRSSPVPGTHQNPNPLCDLKPENLAGSELGNALLSLASLGGLTGFPNFMQGGSNPSSSSPLNLTSQRGSPHGSQMSPGQGGFPFPGSLGSGPMPQLILASGQISQGIQGAQLLIPTSQGIMSQTVLTIPITQPGSPNASSSLPGSGSSTSPLGGRSSRPRPHPASPPGSLLPPNRESTTPPDYSRPRSQTHPHNPLLLGSPFSSLVNHHQQSLMQSHHLPHPQLPTIPEKLDHSMNNGLRNIHGKRDRDGLILPPKSSPACSTNGEDDFCSDKFSDTEDDQMVDGINLDEIKEFAKAFKLRRLSLGLTQTQVGQALSVTEGPAYSQSAICSALAWQSWQSQSYPSSIHQQSMFEKLDITPKSAQKIKPVLERWMKEAEERYKNGHQNLNEFVGMEPSKKRKRRTSFTPQALEILNNHFERNTHPSGAEITTLAHQLGYEREVIRIWFCNKRQALKNTVRMMSKGSSPM